MAEVPVRAVFNERQILSSADLNLVVEHERLTSVQMMRAVTTAGVISGLDFTSTNVPVVATDGTSVVTKQIRLRAGIACDELGRLIVVPDDVPFGEDHFETAVGSGTKDPEDSTRSLPHPVFLAPLDRPRRTTGGVGDTCSTVSGPTRVAEGYELRVGRPGEELPRQLPPIEPTAGPDGDQRDILLGFVCYHQLVKRFVDHSDTNGITSRRYAGLRGDSVNGRHGQVTLRTSAEAPAATPTLTLAAAGDAVLTLGRTGAQGAIDKLFWVDDKGDVYAKGELHGGIKGQTAVESGVIRHGLRVPLPAGVTQDKLDSGAMVLHLILTPVPPDDSNVYVPKSCRADADRRVSCRYVKVNDPSLTAVDGACRYYAIVSVPPAGAV